MIDRQPSYQDDPSETSVNQCFAINDSLPRRILTRLALKTLGRLYKSDGVCTPLSKHIVVKSGPRVHLTEAATMKFVKDNTSVPVPTVHCSFTHKGRTFIVMERIQGTEIPSVWGNLAEAAHHSIYSQLKVMFQELRALKPGPNSGVESCVGGPLCDFRITQRPCFGPFKSIHDFHLWLRAGLHPSEVQHNVEDGEWRDIEKMAAMQDAPWPPPVFTHGDLNPFNILIRGDRVVGIIDWEFAGWYPCYWEYTSAWHGNATRTDWQDALRQFLEQYPAELDMERVRQRWWGEIY